MAQGPARYYGQRSFSVPAGVAVRAISTRSTAHHQRRIKQWRSEIARKLVLGAAVETAECADVPIEQQE